MNAVLVRSDVPYIPLSTSSDLQTNRKCEERKVTSTLAARLGRDSCRVPRVACAGSDWFCGSGQYYHAEFLREAPRIIMLYTRCLFIFEFIFLFSRLMEDLRISLQTARFTIRLVWMLLCRDLFGIFASIHV